MFGQSWVSRQMHILPIIVLRIKRQTNAFPRDSNGSRVLFKRYEQVIQTLYNITYLFWNVPGETLCLAMLFKHVIQIFVQTVSIACYWNVPLRCRPPSLLPSFPAALCPAGALSSVAACAAAACAACVLACACASLPVAALLLLRLVAAAAAAAAARLLVLFCFCLLCLCGSRCFLPPPIWVLGLLSGPFRGSSRRTCRSCSWARTWTSLPLSSDRNGTEQPTSCMRKNVLGEVAVFLWLPSCYYLGTYPSLNACV